jgi:hypothetical protein
MNFNNGFRITGNDLASQDNFGRSVSVNNIGSIALVGAPAKNASYIFTGNGINWIQAAKITGNDSIAGDNFGISVSINSGGNVALIGAFNANSNCGAAYIFTGNQSNWNQAVKITGNDSQAFDRFGWSTSLNSIGNVALIGAYFANPNGLSNGGAAYIFTGSGNNWNQTKKITGDILNETEGYFGRSVSLNSAGNIALVGMEGNVGASAGKAYIFTGSGSNWNQVVKFSGTDATIGDQFGEYVSLNSAGNVAVIGSTSKNPNGAAYIFTGVGSSWNQAAKITGSGGLLNENFGYSPSLNSSGNIIAIGTRFDGATQSTAVYIFTGSGINWKQTNRITGIRSADGDYFSQSISINSTGNVMVVGAYLADPNGATNAGSAYIFTEKLNQTITFPAIATKTFGDPLFYLAGTSTSNLPLTYSGNNSSVTTILGSGVTIVGAGTCEITGYQTGNSDYNAATPIGQTLTVLRGSQTINLTGFYTGVYNETKTYDLSTPQGLPIIYTGNTNIFSIAANNITFINTGVTILTGYNTGSTNYTGITGTQQITVNRANAIIDFPYIPVFNITVTSGYTLNATSNHNESTITYTSSNSGAVSISGANTLLITGTGVGIITAYQPATSHYNEASGQRSFTALNIRNPRIVAVSNLPNNVFFNTGSKYLQGYLQDEGTYHLKLHILEDNILCEKTIVLNVIDTGVRHLYKINYPINIGFIKYNAPQRLGL